MSAGNERPPYWLTEIIRQGKEAAVSDENFAWWVLTAFRVNHFSDQGLRVRAFEFAKGLTKDTNSTAENVTFVLREAQRIFDWVESGKQPDDET